MPTEWDCALGVFLLRLRTALPGPAEEQVRRHDARTPETEDNFPRLPGIQHTAATRPSRPRTNVAAPQSRDILSTYARRHDARMGRRGGKSGPRSSSESMTRAG